MVKSILKVKEVRPRGSNRFQVLIKLPKWAYSKANCPLGHHKVCQFNKTTQGNREGSMKANHQKWAMEFGQKGLGPDPPHSPNRVQPRLIKSPSSSLHNPSSAQGPTGSSPRTKRSPPSLHHQGSTKAQKAKTQTPPKGTLGSAMAWTSHEDPYSIKIHAKTTQDGHTKLKTQTY